MCEYYYFNFATTFEVFDPPIKGIYEVPLNTAVLTALSLRMYVAFAYSYAPLKIGLY